jgi:hypothetical protein
MAPEKLAFADLTPSDVPPEVEAQRPKNTRSRISCRPPSSTTSPPPAASTVPPANDEEPAALPPSPPPLPFGVLLAGIEQSEQAARLLETLAPPRVSSPLEAFAASCSHNEGHKATSLPALIRNLPPHIAAVADTTGGACGRSGVDRLYGHGGRLEDVGDGSRRATSGSNVSNGTGEGQWGTIESVAAGSLDGVRNFSRICGVYFTYEEVPQYGLDLGFQRMWSYERAMSLFTDSEEYASLKETFQSDRGQKSVSQIMDVAVWRYIFHYRRKIEGEEGLLVCELLEEALMHRNQMLRGNLYLTRDSMQSWRAFLMRHRQYI